MCKSFEVVATYTSNKEIKVYECGRRIADVIVCNEDVDGACKILEALGYQLLYRAR
nr:MAG TPA: hypothetical protein [Caudoviricetes sp.]